MKPSLFLGIDPGMSGGLAVLDQAGVIMFAVKMPASGHELADEIRYLEPNLEMTFLERAQMRPGQSTGSGGKFMQQFGLIQGILIARSIKYVLIQPQQWQREIGIPKRTEAEDRTAYKNRLKARAEMLFPEQKFTLSTADAVLIAECCRRITLYDPKTLTKFYRRTHESD